MKIIPERGFTIACDGKSGELPDLTVGMRNLNRMWYSINKEVSRYKHTLKEEQRGLISYQMHGGTNWILLSVDKATPEDARI